MTFSKEIITVLDYLAQKFGVAIDWTSENVTPYLKDLSERFINYEIYTSIWYICISLFITLVLGLVCIPLHSKAKKLGYNCDKYLTCFAAIASWLLFGVSVIVFICVTGYFVEYIIECKTIPEKVIIEYIQEILDGSGKI